jgi:hypothetical protein
MADEVTNEQFSSVPREWFDSNPNVPPSEVASAFLRWKATQPDAVGQLREKALSTLKESAKGSTSVLDKTRDAVMQFITGAAIPESWGGLAGDAVLAAVPPARAGGAIARGARALERGVAGGAAATGVDMATGADMTQAAKTGVQVGASGLLGDALAQGGRFVRKNVMESGVRERDVENMAEGLSHIFQPGTPGPAGFYHSIVGGEARNQTKQAMNTLDDMWVRSFPQAGQTRVALTGIDEALHAAKMGGVTPVVLPGPQPISMVTVDEARDTIRRLKAMGRTARDAKEPLSVAKAQEAQRMADSLEGELVQLMPPQGQAAYNYFQQYAAQANAIVPFLQKVAKIKGKNPFISETPDGPVFNVGAINQAFKDKAAGRKGTNLEMLNNLGGFEDFTTAINRGAGPGAGDVTHGPVRVFGALATHGTHTGGIPLPGTKFTEFAGDTGNAGRFIDPRVGAVGADAARRGLMSFTEE